MNTKKLIIILSSILVGLGIIIFCILFFRTPKIICNGTYVDENNGASTTKSITAYFNRNKTYEKTHMKLIYNFDNKEKYDKWKNIYTTSDDNSLNYNAFETKYEYDDKLLTITIFITIDGNKLINTEFYETFPTKYSKVKEYYVNTGMTCK